MQPVSSFQHPKISSPTCVATSQFLEPFRSRKTQNFTNFPSPTPFIATLNPDACSINTIGLKTRSMTFGFTQKPENSEKPPNSNNKTTKTPPPIIFRPTNNVAHVYIIPQTHSDFVLQLPTPTTTARSSHSPVAENTKDTKKVCFYASFFKLQLSMESLVPITIDTDLEMHLEKATFMKNIKNHQKSPKSPVLGCFKRAN